MVPEALSRQDSVGPLLQSLAQVVQKAAVLPEPILRAALGVLAQRIVVSDGRVRAADIAQGVLRSGVMLEASLLAGTPEPSDAKAGLLALRDGLARWLGAAAPAAVQPRMAAEPPLRGLPLRAAELGQAPLPESPRDAGHLLHAQADAAISRLKLMQLASLPDGDPTRPNPPVLRMELPFLIGHELVLAQLQVSREGPRREADRKRGWSMRFALNFSATGEVGAEVGVLGPVVSVVLWAAEAETAAAMRDALPELRDTLAAVGLSAGSLRVREGAPQGPEAVAAGQLVDSIS